MSRLGSRLSRARQQVERGHGPGRFCLAFPCPVSRCEFKKGQIGGATALFTPKKALPWSLAAPPTTLYLRGNLEFAIPELRAKADLCIKARALDAPTLRTRAPRHSPTITCRPNPCAMAVAGSKHHISILPGGATCTRPKPTHPPVAMRSLSTQFCFVFELFLFCQVG